jgi:hypothetical protein
MPYISQEKWDDLLRLRSWIALGLVAEIAPLSVSVIAQLSAGKPADLHSLLGYSTPLLIAFAILLMGVCEVVLEGIWREASDGAAAATIIALIIVCQFSGMAIAIDAGLRPSAMPDAPNIWLYGQGVGILVLLLWSGQIKVWMLGRQRLRGSQCPPSQVPNP